jgi:hypothetical protein
MYIYMVQLKLHNIMKILTDVSKLKWCDEHKKV